ncbi:MAG: hypothetical protein R2874_10315 [Desulfobacterales bacterium]
MKLEDALNNNKRLQGIIPICANCKSIHNGSGSGEQLKLPESIPMRDFPMAFARFATKYYTATGVRILRQSLESTPEQALFSCQTTSSSLQFKKPYSPYPF